MPSTVWATGKVLACHIGQNRCGHCKGGKILDVKPLNKGIPSLGALALLGLLMWGWGALTLLPLST